MSRRYALAPFLCTLVIAITLVTPALVHGRTAPIDSKAHGHGGKDHKALSKKGSSASLQAHHSPSYKRSPAHKDSVTKASRISLTKKPAATHAKNQKRGSKKVAVGKGVHPVKARRSADTFMQGDPLAMDLSFMNTQTKADLWLAREDPGTYSKLKRELLDTSQGDPRIQDIIVSAYSYLGVPYRYGGTSPSGFDCSGFVHRVFWDNGIILGRSSREQMHYGVPVEKNELLPGDLVFFRLRSRTGSPVDHVGLYVGEGKFIHASTHHKGMVTIDSLDWSTYKNSLVGARRVLLQEMSGASRIIE